MLEYLQIENIAIIEKASIDFIGGLNVLTGETGAGKSIIIDSINALIGEKTSRELIRTGESSAFVSAVFSGISENVLKKLEENDIPAEADGTLSVQRRIFRDGKNACRVNGVPLTVSMLKNIGSALVNIHGQRDSAILLDSARHLEIIDTYCGNSGILTEYKTSFEELSALKARLKALKTDEALKARKTDLLSFQINELEAANITPGEIKELTHKKNILRNSKKLSDAIMNALACLQGDGENGSAESLIYSALGSINSVCSIAKDLSVVAQTLEGAGDAVSDTCEVLRDVLEQLSSVEGDLDAIEERLDVLFRLSKKYGETEDEMLGFLLNAQKELAEINLSDEEIEKLNAVYPKKLENTVALAKALTDERLKAAEKLCENVTRELSFLNMPNVIFTVVHNEQPLGESGADNMEFYISANAGEEPKPLGKTASGGELSRIMLALKSVLSDKFGADTLIFDEVDTGISGEAAGKTAMRLWKASKGAQVLCVTHLSQIAAFADGHMLIRKQSHDGKTFTSVTPLTRQERACELARMTYGEKISETQLSSACQLLSDAAELKKSL